MRDRKTYRTERRNDWAGYRRLYRGIEGAIPTWRDFNVQVHGSAGFGIPQRLYPPTFARSAIARSKYMPHIGNKEHSRYPLPRSNGGGR